VDHKASGFADDVSIISKNDIESVEQIFYEYQRLTLKSGLRLNAEKTEILNLNGGTITHEVEYCNEIYKIVSVKVLKICGVFFCEDHDEEYTRNVKDKIAKLKNNIVIWKPRRLTMEGKSLIIKTFGISQLIYIMQCVKIDATQLSQIEQYIFNFLWDTKDYEATRARDRIKRSILKNDFNEGGLKIIDIECMDKALKLKQYIRASKSKHNICKIQQFCIEEFGETNMLATEFAKPTQLENVSMSAQETINVMTDTNRNNMYNCDSEDIDSTIAINQIAMTKVSTYLNRKSRVFLRCIFEQFRKEGMESLLDVVTAAETEMCRKKSKRLEAIIEAFPKYFRNATNCFDENINSKEEEMTHFLKADSSWVPIHDVTTKDLQLILKSALNKTSNFEPGSKLGINLTDKLNITLFRENCKNIKLRSIHFRLIHNDFFTYSRMFKFKMCNSPKCPRCEENETTKHLLWECRESQKIWKYYNEIISEQGMRGAQINTYEDIYTTDKIGPLSIIKMKIVQEFIQIERPVNWSKERVKQLIINLRNIEMFNLSNQTKPVNSKWKNFMNIKLLIEPTTLILNEMN
jgi:hypothetical protein